jgi:rhodanese-related sulfurtransferase
MKQHSNRFLQLALDTKQRIRETDVKTVKTKLDNEEVFYLIDVREKEEWDNGHLPHAIHLSKGVIERDIEKIIQNPDAEIVLYCGGGYRSALAADNLNKMGYSNVFSMDGGFTAWTANGYEIKRG